MCGDVVVYGRRMRVRVSRGIQAQDGVKCGEVSSRKRV